MNITFTFDVEYYGSSSGLGSRFDKIVRYVLDFLKELEIHGTFFIVGEVAKRNTKLVQEIAAGGHEIGFHSYKHIPLDQVQEKIFKEEAKKGKTLLEEVSGQKVIGFRAPVFSLIHSTIWAIDVINELGFKYSSSVIPAYNPLYGFPGLPECPFYWHNEILEFPCPVARIGPFRLPFVGGIYLRYLPDVIWRLLLKKCLSPIIWTYCHPYDFDTKEPFCRIDNTSLPVSVLLWLNRGRTIKKMRKLLKGRSGHPLGKIYENVILEQPKNFKNINLKNKKIEIRTYPRNK